MLILSFSLVVVLFLDFTDSKIGKIPGFISSRRSRFTDLTRQFLAKNYLAKQPGQTSFTARVGKMWGKSGKIKSLNLSVSTN